MTIVQQRVGEPAIRTDVDGMKEVLGQLDTTCYVQQHSGQIGVATTRVNGARLIAAAPPCPPQRLGSPAFRQTYGLTSNYVAGAMAGGISSVSLVTAMSEAGYLGSFGTGGLGLQTIDERVAELQASTAGRAFMINLLHAPHDQELEVATVELFLRREIRHIEASAFMEVTPGLVRYRVAGLGRRDGRTVVGNRIMAKVSRVEIAAKFLAPAPARMVSALLDKGLVTAEQAELARNVPMADEITVEADSGGHTDGRPLVASFPLFVAECERARKTLRTIGSVRLGAAGGIGTPDAVAAAFALGADYVVTGSINQTCTEADTSAEAKAMLAAADVADFDIAPAADMFEMGAHVQVLKRSTMFAPRAQRLRQLFERYESLEDLPTADRNWLEQKVLLRSIDELWPDIREYLVRRNSSELPFADEPRRKMALVFRWYLGSSSRWAREGDPQRVVDYQLWAGPALGAFNRWVSGSCLGAVEDRRVGEVAANMMYGAALMTRFHHLRTLGVRLPGPVSNHRPVSDCAATVRRLARRA